MLPKHRPDCAPRVPKILLLEHRPDSIPRAPSGSPKHQRSVLSIGVLDAKHPEHRVLMPSTLSTVSRSAEYPEHLVLRLRLLFALVEHREWDLSSPSTPHAVPVCLLSAPRLRLERSRVHRVRRLFCPSTYRHCSAPRVSPSTSRCILSTLCSVPSTTSSSVLGTEYRCS